MNREIEFRAWDGKEMGCFGLSDICAHGDVIYADKDGDFTIEMPLMQYTGLNDKNGVKIFEGDVIMISATDFSHSFPETIDDIFKAHSLCGESSTHWEVIGDIHQNPELIN
jgi:uncharacterized phage protein (TIGR01671 family)